MKNNLKEKLTELVSMSEKVLILEQETLDMWHETIESKKMSSEEANNTYEPVITDLSNIQHKLYTEYYNLVHSLVSNEKVDEIQKKINYNFMSLDFINELVKEI